VLEAKGGIDLDDFDDKENPATYRQRREATVARLGADVALNPAAFEELLPELVGGRGQLWTFGQALALAASNPNAMWDSLVAAFAASPAGNTQVLNGFLVGLQTRDAKLAEKLLDDAVEHPALGPVFPSIQASVVIDADGVARLLRALTLGVAPMLEYNYLAGGRTCDPIPGPLFRDLILAIAGKLGGQAVALHIQSMRIFSDRTEKRDPLRETVEAGRQLVAALDFSSKKANGALDDHDLALVVCACLGGSEGLPIATGLCQRMIEAMNVRRLSASDYADTMSELCKLHPAAMLNIIFAGDAKAQARSAQNIDLFMRHRKNPLDEISDADLLAWCDEQPAVRYPLIVSCVSLSSSARQQDGRQDWKPLSIKLLEKAPNPETVLNAMFARMRPMSWSGSRASKMETRLRFLEKLALPNRPGLAETWAKAVAAFKAEIEAERKHETEEERQRSGKFE
jgi:hypothetical protein